MKCAGSGFIRYAEVWKGMKIVPYTKHLSKQCENKENSNYVTAFFLVKMSQMSQFTCACVRNQGKER